MGKRIRSALAILICSLLAGCSLTIGPKVENKHIIVNAGVPIECLQQVTVKCHVLKDSGETNIIEQDVGGWIMMPPDHWKSIKSEIQRLRVKAGE